MMQEDGAFVVSVHEDGKPLSIKGWEKNFETKLFKYILSCRDLHLSKLSA